MILAIYDWFSPPQLWEHLYQLVAMDFFVLCGSGNPVHSTQNARGHDQQCLQMLQIVSRWAKLLSAELLCPAPPPNKCNLLVTKPSPATSYLPVPGSARQDHPSTRPPLWAGSTASLGGDGPASELVMDGLQQGPKSRLRVVWVPVTSCDQQQQAQTRKKSGLGD